MAARSARFADYRDYLLTSTTITMAVADLNHDGIPDVLAETGIAILLGKCDGRSRHRSLPEANPSSYLNQDGKPDLVITVLLQLRK